MATCRISENTGWRVLKALEIIGLIVREKSFRNSNSYLVATKSPIPVTAKETATQNESPQSGGRQSPRKERRQSPQSRGRKGNPSKGIQERESKGDSNSAPIGTAMIPLVWDDVKDLALRLHQQDRSNPNGIFGMFPPEEIEIWAKDWLLNYEATGGMHKGSLIRNPAAALESYLKSCAANQSKRFKELSGRDTEDESPSPFGQ